MPSSPGPPIKIKLDAQGADLDIISVLESAEAELAQRRGAAYATPESSNMLDIPEQF